MSFISTYSALSTRGLQSSTGGQQMYSLIGTQIGNTAGSNTNTLFGFSVDVSEYVVSNKNLTIVGALTYQPSFINDPGAVFFTAFSNLSAPIVGNSASDQLGGDVTISADANYAVGSAPSASVNPGYIQIYEADGSKNFTILDTLYSPYTGEYGYGADLNNIGDVMAVHCRVDTVANVAAGSVVIYTRSGNTWTEEQRIYANDVSSSNGTGFGESISLNAVGNCVAVGATRDSNNAGAVYIFTSSSNTWSQTAKIIASDRANDDRFGANCCISSDSQYLVVGAPNAGTSDVGAAYVYANVSNSWTELAKLSSTSTTANSVSFGQQVSISTGGNTIVVADPQAIVSGVTRGAIYVFTKEGNNYYQTQEIINPNGYTGNGQFGFNMAMTYDGKRLVVSDLNYKSGNTQLGAVYLYQSFF